MQKNGSIVCEDVWISMTEIQIPCEKAKTIASVKSPHGAALRLSVEMRPRTRKSGMAQPCHLVATMGVCGERVASSKLHLHYASASTQRRIAPRLLAMRLLFWRQGRLRLGIDNGINCHTSERQRCGPRRIVSQVSAEASSLALCQTPETMAIANPRWSERSEWNLGSRKQSWSSFEDAPHLPQYSLLFILPVCFHPNVSDKPLIFMVKCFFSVVLLLIQNIVINPFSGFMGYAKRRIFLTPPFK